MVYKNNCIDCGIYGPVIKSSGQCEKCDKLIDDIIAHSTEYCPLCDKYLEYSPREHIEKKY